MKALILLLTLALVGPAHAGLRMGPQGFIKTLAAADVPERVISTTRLAGDLLIKADPNNAGPVIIGGSNVDIDTGNGIILQPGEAVGFEHLWPASNVEYYDLNEFWVEVGTGNAPAILQITYVTGFEMQ